MCPHNTSNSCPTQQRNNNNRMIFRNSSIVVLGFLTCAAVIVQAFASPPPSSNIVSPWGTRGGGAHVGQKKKKGGSIPSSNPLSMSVNDDAKKGNSEPDREIDINKAEEIPSPLIRPLNGMSADNNGTSSTTSSASATVGKAKKTILTPGGFADSIIPATYVAETNLPTDIGHFRIRAYRIEEFEDRLRQPHPLGAGAGLGSEPCVIYCTDKPPFGLKGGEKGGAKEVPVRIHDQCFTSEVFRSQR